MAVTETDFVNDSRHFTATYVDTEDGRLARAGVVLRRRMENGKNVWEVEIGNATRAADGGPAGPPEEILRLTHGPSVGTRARRDRQDADPCERRRRRDGGARGPARHHDGAGLEVRQQVDELARHDPGARLDDDPERIHRIRVATRRARSALRTARPLLDREWAQGLREELKWLGNELAPPRDLDVLLAASSAAG